MAKCDDLRPRGTVPVPCSGGCGFEVFIEVLDPRLPDGPFTCPSCSGEPMLTKDSGASGLMFEVTDRQVYEALTGRDLFAPPLPKKTGAN